MASNAPSWWDAATGITQGDLVWWFAIAPAIIWIVRVWWTNGRMDDDD